MFVPGICVAKRIKERNFQLRLFESLGEKFVLTRTDVIHQTQKENFPIFYLNNISSKHIASTKNNINI